MSGVVSLLCFVLCVPLHQASERQGIVLEDVPSQITKEISFIFYGGPSVENSTTIPFVEGLSLLDQEQYDPDLKTVFYFHGWSEQPAMHLNYSTGILAEAFVRWGGANFVAVEYARLVQHQGGGAVAGVPLAGAGAGYAGAARNASQLGAALGGFLRRLVAACRCERRLHLVGFSLGAHVMAYAAQRYGRGRLPHLTALDAAGPLFEVPGVPRLSPADGKFVDVVHTDGGRMGLLASVGTADFYPNYGAVLQPHCQLHMPMKCSHYMSVWYYAESVGAPRAFPARRCASGLAWAAGACAHTPVAHMGYHVDTRASGDYYLQTNPDAPFGKGEHDPNKISPQENDTQ